MELGRLTLLCMNLVCVGAIVSLVFVLLLAMRPPAKKRPRIYSEPPGQQYSGLLNGRGRSEEDVFASEERKRIEV